MEFPTQDGGTVTGNTILDPTWNLAAQRFGGRPNNFCRSYEEIRKHDIKVMVRILELMRMTMNCQMPHSICLNLF